MFINMNKYIEFVYKYEHYFTLVLIGKTPDVQPAIAIGTLAQLVRAAVKVYGR